MEIITKRKSTEYLYVCKPCEFAELPYKRALEFKIKKGKHLLTELLNIHFMQRDDERIKAVIKAIEFNQFLLRENNNIHG